MARHCGYCGNCGHNRRTCPDLRSSNLDHLRALQRQLEDATPGGDREEYITRRINATGKALGKLTGTNPVTGENVARKRASERKCSYCKKFAHTRRTCEILKQDQEVYREATRIARRVVAAQIEETQVGIGTMYTTRTGYYSAAGKWEYGLRPFIITRAALDQYTFNSSSFLFISCQAGRLNEATNQRYAETVTLSTLQNLLTRTAEQNSGDVICHPAGPLRVSEEWLAATDIDWANVSWFEKGKRQYHDFQSLRIKNRRAHTNDVLVQAARNTGCIPMED